MDVEEGEDDHFAADESRGDVEVDVVIGEGEAGFRDVGRGKNDKD